MDIQTRRKQNMNTYVPFRAPPGDVMTISGGLVKVFWDSQHIDVTYTGIITYQVHAYWNAPNIQMIRFFGIVRYQMSPKFHLSA